MVPIRQKMDTTWVVPISSNSDHMHHIGGGFQVSNIFFIFTLTWGNDPIRWVETATFFPSTNDGLTGVWGTTEDTTWMILWQQVEFFNFLQARTIGNHLIRDLPVKKNRMKQCISTRKSIIFRHTCTKKPISLSGILSSKLRLTPHASNDPRFPGEASLYFELQ